MILFGHLGFTAGAFKLYEKVIPQEKRRLPDIDYRFVLLGSILPDLIDKPIGALLFINTFHNSRIYAHTLLFSLGLIIVGLILLKKRKRSSVLVLGMGSLVHVLLDSMWVYPETMLWPILNIKAALLTKTEWVKTLLSFPYRFDKWLEGDLSELLKNPAPLIFECAGAAILAYFFIRLIRNSGLTGFFKTGKL